MKKEKKYSSGGKNSSGGKDTGHKKGKSSLLAASNGQGALTGPGKNWKINEKPEWDWDFDGYLD